MLEYYENESKYEISSKKKDFFNVQKIKSGNEKKTCEIILFLSHYEILNDIVHVKLLVW